MVCTKCFGTHLLDKNTETCVTTCAIKYEEVAGSTGGRECHIRCGSGSYREDPTTCQDCSDNCAKCSDNATNCTECKEGMELGPNNICAQSCNLTHCNSCGFGGCVINLKFQGTIVYEDEIVQNQPETNEQTLNIKLTLSRTDGKDF